MKFYPILMVIVFFTSVTGCLFTQEAAQEIMKGSSTNPEIEPEDKKNCWAELFKNPDFALENSHIRLSGPVEVPTLKQIEGQDWNDEIQSLIVGPNATVHVYQNREYSGTELIFMPNQRINSELNPVGMSKNIESLKVQCQAG